MVCFTGLFRSFVIVVGIVSIIGIINIIGTATATVIVGITLLLAVLPVLYTDSVDKSYDKKMDK